MNNFAELGLSKLALASLEDAGFVTPTEIQAKTIASIVAGRDVLASASTGSGKTAAYALPIIDRLASTRRNPRALVLVPTRELALQVKEHFDIVGKHTRLRVVAVYGGAPYGAQIAAMNRGADVVVATPGRLTDLFDRRIVNLSAVEMLVLDEADRMLDMGFMPQVRQIISKVPAKRQTVMFSATIDQRISRIAGEYLQDPLVVKVEGKTLEAESVDQNFHEITELGKDGLLLQLIDGADPGAVLVFTRTRRKAHSVVKRLRDANVRAEEIHSDISQNKREKTLAHYRKGVFRVLVATDIAARGLDVPSISHVINYDLPQSAEDYVHRIGRTGRAGRTGVAHSFISEDQRGLARNIERLLGRKILAALPARPRSAARPNRFGRRRFAN